MDLESYLIQEIPGLEKIQEMDLVKIKKGSVMI